MCSQESKASILLNRLYSSDHPTIEAYNALGFSLPPGRHFYIFIGAQEGHVIGKGFRFR